MFRVASRAKTIRPMRDDPGDDHRVGDREAERTRDLHGALRQTVWGGLAGGAVVSLRGHRRGCRGRRHTSSLTHGTDTGDQHQRREEHRPTPRSAAARRQHATASEETWHGGGRRYSTACATGAASGACSPHTILIEPRSLKSPRYRTASALSEPIASGARSEEWFVLVPGAIARGGEYAHPARPMHSARGNGSTNIEVGDEERLSGAERRSLRGGTMRRCRPPARYWGALAG